MARRALDRSGCWLATCFLTAGPLAVIGIQTTIGTVAIDPVGLAELLATTATAVAPATSLLGSLLAIVFAMVLAMAATNSSEAWQSTAATGGPELRTK